VIGNSPTVLDFRVILPHPRQPVGFSGAREVAEAVMLVPWPKPESRFEFKYTVPEALAREIAAYAAPWTAPDKHVPPGQTGYTITSTYLDTPDMRFLWEKRTLQRNRIKLRIRAYGDRSEGPFFAEIKRRFGDVMVKTRALMPREAIPFVADPSGGAEDPGSFASKRAGIPVLRDFTALVRELELRPVVVVRYDREPLAGVYDSHTRLTFDRRLRCCIPRKLEVTPDDRDFQAVDFAALFDKTQSEVIVELKFDNRAPFWMQDLIYRFDLIRSSFSKYVAGLDVLGDQARLSVPSRLVPLGSWQGRRTWTS